MKEKIKLTTNDIFLSSRVTDMYTKHARYLTGLKDIKVVINAHSDADYVAYTDGTDVCINAANFIMKEIENESVELKNTHLKGLLVHECGHIIFSDFKLLNDAVTMAQDGKLIYKITPLFPEDDIYLHDFVEILNDSYFARDFFAKLLQSLLNISEDKWMELKMMIKYPGLKKAILFNEAKLICNMQSFEEMKELNSFCIIHNFILQYIRGGFILSNKENEYTKVLETLKPVLDKIVCEDNYSERIKMTLQTIVHLFPLFKNDILAENKSLLDSITESSHCDSVYPSNSNDAMPSKEATQNELNKNNEALKNALINAGLEPDSSLNTKNDDFISEDNSVPDSLSDKPQSANKDNKDSNVSNTLNKNLYNSFKEKSDTDSSLNKILKELKKDKANCENEKYIKQSLLNDTTDIKMPKGLAFCKIKVKRENSNLLKYKRYYDIVYPEINKLSKVFSKKLESILIDPEGSVENGLLLGKKLDNKNLYRQDKRIFTKEDLPSEGLNLAVCILVDASGSMYRDNRMEFAKIAALTIYNFCQNEGIPVSVYSHSEDANQNIVIESLAEFDSQDGLDKYRICSLYPNGCNIDGVAIRYAANRLLKRNEENKLLFIISDGQPSGNGHYYGDSAINDTREAFMETKKHGIIPIAAAIGNDREIIKSIYKNNYLNISNNKKMPEVLLNILKQFIR